MGGFKKKKEESAEAREAIPKLQNLLAAEARRDQIIFWSAHRSYEASECNQGKPLKMIGRIHFSYLPLTRGWSTAGSPGWHAEAKEYRRSLSDSLAIIEKQIDTAQSVISASGGVLARMQGTRSTMLES
jgi:hypothetical protein